MRPSSRRGSGKARVLVIEDEEVLARAMRRVIEKLGADVEVANDGVTATSLVMANDFDAIVTDIHMPGATGVDLLRTIRAYNLDVPVLLVTGEPSVETAAAAVELGAQRYLVKPVDPALLAKEVQRAVSLHRLARLKREVLREMGADGQGPGDLAGLSTRFDKALDQLWIAFQPIIDLRKREVFGYEALLRSREPSLPGPLDVINAAERLDAVLELGGAVRAKTAEAMRALDDERASIFVNIHPLELMDASLYASTGPLTPFASRVVLEVTERATLEKLQDLHARTSVLRFHGYRLAIDDLGAGYAGLTSFVTLEPELVKLDMALVRGISRSPIRQQLVRSMVELCTSLDMITVGEGVETIDELRTLRELGVHLAQGYLIGRPEDGFAAIDWSRLS